MLQGCWSTKKQERFVVSSIRALFIIGEFYTAVFFLNTRVVEFNTDVEYTLSGPVSLPSRGDMGWTLRRINTRTVYLNISYCRFGCYLLQSVMKGLNNVRDTLKSWFPLLSCNLDLLSKVPDQNVVSEARYIVEIHHSCREPSVWIFTN